MSFEADPRTLRIQRDRVCDALTEAQELEIRAKALRARARIVAASWDIDVAAIQRDIDNASRSLNNSGVDKGS